MCTDYDVHIVNGTAVNSGILLICINGAWGTVIYNDINNIASDLICHKYGHYAS